MAFLSTIGGFYKENTKQKKHKEIHQKEEEYKSYSSFFYINSIITLNVKFFFLYLEVEL